MNRSILKVFAGIIFIALIGGGVYQFLIKSQQQEQSARKQIRSGVAETGDVSDLMKLKGVTASDKKISVFPEASGQVIKVHVQKGEKVKAGDRLLTLDQAQLKREIMKKEMTVKKADITFRNAQQIHQRKQALFKEQLISEADLDESKKGLELARLDFEIEQKDLDLMNQQIGKKELLATLDGIITEKYIEEGDTLQINESQSGERLFVITDTSQKHIEVLASEVELSRLQLGKKVEFWMEAKRGKRYPGEINQIDAAAVRRSQNIGLFRVGIAILEEDVEFLLGASAVVEIVINEAKGVITVPVEAIFRDGEETYVYRLGDSGYEKHSVETGISSAARIEIRRGLKSGDAVALELPPEEEA